MNRKMFTLKNLLFAALFGTFCFSVTTANAQQLLINGDIELWIPGCPYNTAPDNWNNYSTSLGPDQAGTCAGTRVAQQGSSYMNLVWTDAGLREGASQIVSGLVVGVMYKVTFYAANSNGLYAATGPGAIDVQLDQVSIFSSPETPMGGSWVQYEVEFTATATSHTIAFQVLPGSTNTSGSMGVDNIVLGPSVGIRDNMMHELSLYPNPVSDVLMIDQGDYITEDLADVRISILNIVGQTVQSGVVNFSSGKASVDVQDLEAGVYFMQLEIGDETKIEKFLVK